MIHLNQHYLSSFPNYKTKLDPNFNLMHFTVFFYYIQLMANIFNIFNGLGYAKNISTLSYFNFA